MNSLQAVLHPLGGRVAPRNRRRNPFWRFRRLFFVLALGAVIGVGSILYIFAQTPLPEDTFDELAQTSYICTAEVQADCGPENATAFLANPAEDRDLVTYDELPLHLIQALVAVEDQSFFDHRGVDPKGITRAAYQFARRQGVQQGGSTLTQQYVKLAFEDADRNLSRKAREAIRAIKLESEFATECADREDLGDRTPKLCAKEEILTRYFNRAYFGRGASGVKAAARAYFDKDVSDLTVPESAFLVGLLRAPNGAEPETNFEEADWRRETALTNMMNLGFLTPAEAQAANASEWTHIPRRNLEGLGEVKGSEYGSEYFVEEVRLQLEEIFPDRNIRTAGLRVYTTLDHGQQRAAFEAVHTPIPGEVPEERAKAPEIGPAWLDPNNPDDPQAGLVSIDDEGRVRALLGGANFAESELNLATSRGAAGRQPGSLFKVLGLAAAIDQGISPKSVYPAPPGRASIGGRCEDSQGNPWRPVGGSSASKRYRDLIEATMWSSNVVYAQLVVDIGPDVLRDTAINMGVSAPLGDPQPGGGLFVPCGLILGVKEVSVLDMATAYSTIEREGRTLQPAFIERIENVDGEILCWYPINGVCNDSPERIGHQAIDPLAARQTANVMMSVIESGTGTEAKFSEEWPMAGKTGTSQNNRDAWFGGFTCDITTVVWVGYKDGDRIMRDFRKPKPEGEIELDEDGFIPDDRNWTDVAGGNMPSWIWGRFMAKITEGKTPCESLNVDANYDGAILNSELTQATLPPCGVELDQWGFPRGSSPDDFVYIAPTTQAPQSVPPGQQPPPQQPQNVNNGQRCIPVEQWAFQRDPGFVATTTPSTIIPIDPNATTEPTGPSTSSTLIPDSTPPSGPPSSVAPSTGTTSPAPAQRPSRPKRPTTTDTTTPAEAPDG